MGSLIPRPKRRSLADAPELLRERGEKIRVRYEGMADPQAERKSLQRQLERSHDTIARSRKIIAILEQIVARAEGIQGRPPRPHRKQ
jgi:hypothetical protein